MKFTITEEIRGNGKTCYWVGRWSYDIEGCSYFDEKYKWFETLELAKEYIDEQTVVSYKKVYEV